MRAFLAALSVILATPTPAAPTGAALANPTGKPIVRRLALGNDVSLVVVSSAGTTVFLDPRSTTLVPDLVAITHDHHVDRTFLAAAAKAKLLVAEPGTIEAKGVKVTGVAASHGPTPVKAPPDYVIMLVEVDGLRLAYMPCLAQAELTPTQRAALGKVDVVMISAENESGGRTAKARYALARQLQPKLVLTLTHHISDYELALDDIAEAGGKVEAVTDPLVLDAAALRAGPERVVNLLATVPPG
jgi:L-ascorbate metabolism protein UlaG (beta-lactamase superfamily)